MAPTSPWSVFILYSYPVAPVLNDQSSSTSGLLFNNPIAGAVSEGVVRVEKTGNQEIRKKIAIKNCFVFMLNLIIFIKIVYYSSF